MTPPLSHIETVFYQNMRRIRRNNNNCAEELRILINYHEGDIDSGRDRIFSRSENEYIIRRYQAELHALPLRYIPYISSSQTHPSPPLEEEEEDALPDLITTSSPSPSLLPPINHTRTTYRHLFAPLSTRTQSDTTLESVTNMTPITLLGRRVTGASPLSSHYPSLRHPGGRL
jgi:hypothetical protein